LAKKTTKTRKRSAPAKGSSTGRKRAKVAKKTAKKATKKAARKTTRKASKKAPARKKAAKKTAKKTTKKAAKPTKKTTRTTAKKTQKASKKTAKKSTGAKPPAKPEPADKKTGRKGITIVSKKTTKKAGKSKTVMPTFGAGLAQMKRKPLIPSGPKNVPAPGSPAAATSSDGDVKSTKSPFNKRELAKFKKILIAKRLELIGDVSEMEREALLSGTGGLSHTPSHMAEQGSDAYDQSLSLDLAAVDRKLIKEIDDALGRIEKGTYGLCELTGKPIRPERLEELPWARHSIDAARELERRSMRS
jgi:RNA polymerase-binding transcription factor DksA